MHQNGADEALRPLQKAATRSKALQDVDIGHSDASSLDTPPSNSLESTWEDELKARTLDMIQAGNDRQYEIARYKYLAPDFRGNINSMDEGLTGPELMAMLKERADRSEGQHFIQVERLWVEISDNRAYARVFLDMDIAGYPGPDMRSKGISLFKWRRRKSEWLCYEHTHMKHLCDHGPLI